MYKQKKRFKFDDIQNKILLQLPRTSYRTRCLSE